MTTRAFYNHRSRTKKKIDYSNYHFALALYTIYKKESKKEARIAVHDFRNHVFQKHSGTIKLKQKLERYILAIKKAITSMFLLEKRNMQLLTNKVA